jgi:hypothetical protein
LESQSAGNVDGGRNEDVGLANLPKLKVVDAPEPEASVHDVTPAVGTVDPDVQTANTSASADVERHGLDDPLHTASLKEEYGEDVAHEAPPVVYLPASLMHETADGDSGLYVQTVVHETDPSVEQRAEGDIMQESVAIGILPPAMLDQAAAAEIVDEKPDIIPNALVQLNDGSLDPMAQASIPAPAVTVLGFEAAEGEAKEMRTDAPGSGSASRRSPDKSPDKSPEAAAQSASLQSTSLNSIGGFPENGFQSMVEILDVDSNETDSTMGEMTQSSTVSLNSELYDHVEENGRSYHRYKQGKYVLPNDETEQNRLDLQHHLFLLTLQGELHLAPLKPGIHNALDIATGTGIWAIEFAAKYPSANVIGTDLSPIQPLFVPPNCHFEVDDAEDDWVYSHDFDYIHGRLLLSCFRTFPPIVAKAYAALHPGGWFELQDSLPLTCLDDSWNGTDIQRWVNLTLEGAARLGMDWHKVGKYKEWLEEAGFVDVQEVPLVWPSNTWPRSRHHKQLGIWMNQYVHVLYPFHYNFPLPIP